MTDSIFKKSLIGITFGLMIYTSCSTAELSEQEEKKFLEAKYQFIQKDFIGTLKLLDLLIKDKPDFFYARLLKIKALYYSGQSEKALEEILKVKKKNANHPELLFLEGKLLTERKNKEDVIKGLTILNQLVIDDPYHFRAQYELGKVYKELGQFKESLLAYRSALTIEPYLMNIKLDIMEMYKKLDLNEKVMEMTSEFKKSYIDVIGSDAQKERLKKISK